MPRPFNKASFFKDLGYEPHPGQAPIHASTASRRVVACGVRWGKTLCAAMEGLAAAMAPAGRSMGWVVAPTYDLAEKVFREIVILAAEHLRHRIVTLKEHERRLVLRNMSGGLSEIRGKSADNPISLLGEGLDWVVIDEASRLKPLIWESYLSQRLIDRAGWALLISTPKGKGWFYDLYRRGQGDDPDHASWNAPSWQNPHLDREVIERERDRSSERVFRQEYGGEFLEGSGSVFRYVREAALGEWEGPQPCRRYSAGLDLARVEDYTVLVIMNDRRRVVFVDRYQRQDWSVQVQRIEAACLRYSNPLVHVDSTGMGEPIYENLFSRGVRVRPYPFTSASKAALIDNLVLLFERQRITLPRFELWPEGIEELEAFEYSMTDTGHVRMSAPWGQHDDCVIALGLAAWPLRERPMHVRYRGPAEVARRLFPRLRVRRPIGPWFPPP